MNRPAMRRIPAVLAALAAGLLASIAPAYAEEDFFEPVALGMGGAGRVLPVDTSSLHLNPAAMALVAKYYGSTAYHHSLRERSHTFSNGASDSTRMVALGTKYTVRTFRPPFSPERDLNWYPVDQADDLIDKRTWHRWDVAVGVALLERRLTFGVTGRVIRQVNQIRENRTFFTLDAGIGGRIAQPVLISVSAQNMIPTRDSRYPTRFAGGMGLDLTQPGAAFGLKAEATGVIDFTSLEKPVADLHAGVEGTIARFVAVRGGYYSDRRFRDHHVTWGLGGQLGAPAQGGQGTMMVRLNLGMSIQAGKLTERIREDKSEGLQRIVWNLGIDIGAP